MMKGTILHDQELDFILRVSESHWGKGEKARPFRRLGER